jgi:DNA-binding protein HU-beta
MGVLRSPGCKRPRGEEWLVTKQEFVDQVADRAGLSKADAGKAVDAFLDTVTAVLKGRESVNFTGFGKFSTSDRAARMGVNPRTGEKVQIAATTVPKFSAGSKLKADVKGGGQPAGEW